MADGRLHFGIVRRDPVPENAEILPLVSVGYSLFVPAKLIPKRSRAGAARLLATLPVVMLLPGGRFQSALDEWLAGQEIHPQVVARVSSFLAAAAIVNAGHAAAVLPDLATTGLQGQSVTMKSLPWDHRRELGMIWNNRGLERAGFGMREVKGLAGALRRNPTIEPPRSRPAGKISRD